MKRIILTAAAALATVAFVIPATASASATYHACPRPSSFVTHLAVRNGAPRAVTCQTATALARFVAGHPTVLVSWHTFSGIRWRPQFFAGNTFLAFFSQHDLPNGFDVYLTTSHPFS
jgi:hypothetical protein